MLALDIKFVWYVIKIIITLHAPYCVSLEMINLVIIHATIRDKKCVWRVGAVKHVINLYVRKDVCTECAKVQVIFFFFWKYMLYKPQNRFEINLIFCNVQVFANVGMDIKVRDATNAWHILDAKMASARGHGNVYVLQTGVGFYAIMVSTMNCIWSVKKWYDSLIFNSFSVLCNCNMCEFFTLSGCTIYIN